MTAAGMVSGTSANGVANTVANSVLPADDEPSLRRWLFAAVAVVLVHAAIVFWILYVRDMRAAGVQPEAIMIELAPVDVAPPSDQVVCKRPDRRMNDVDGGGHDR